VCPQCEHAKTLLRRYNVPFKEYVIGVDITRDQVIEDYPYLRTAPIIIKDGTPFLTYESFVMWVAHTDFSKNDQLPSET
jgi:glutaredoxin